MSFAYIDSQGKEVPIPGPDALRLRIELGAITDSTQFYDAGSDRWGPASEHEIYRQLKRDISSSQSGGFTAPPPSTIGPAAPSLPGAPPPPTTASDATTPSDADAGGGAEESAADDPANVLPHVDDAFEPWDPEPGESDGIGHELDEIVASGADEDPSHDDLFYPQGASADELDAGMDGFTLADLDAPVIVDDDAFAGGGDASSEDPSPAGGEDARGVEDEGGFDFGSGTLELDEEDREVEAETIHDRGLVDADALPVDADTLPVVPRAPLGPGSDDETPDFGMAFEGGAPDDDFGDDVEVDAPAAEPVAAVDEEDTVAGGGAAADEAGEPGGDGRDDPYRRTVRERRGPRSAPPRRPRDGGGRGRIAAVVVGIAVIAAGAWFVTRGAGGDAGPGEPRVVLPDLPAELEPQLRTLARSASQAMVAEFDSLPQRLALAPEPADRWLSGTYLANASAFPGVREYWVGVGALLDEMIAREDALWEAAFERALDSASVSPGAATQLRRRALAGWAAAAPDRRGVHAELRGIVDASLELHEFLLRNEPAITYAPGTGGGAGDPVLEAVPDTPELGDAMWDRVGDITLALDALGYLQQVETESLLERVKAKLVATGFR